MLTAVRVTASSPAKVAAAVSERCNWIYFQMFQIDMRRRWRCVGGDGEIVNSRIKGFPEEYDKCSRRGRAISGFIVVAACDLLLPSFTQQLGKVSSDWV